MFQIHFNLLSSILFDTVFENIHMSAAALRLGNRIPDNGKLLLWMTFKMRGSQNPRNYIDLCFG